MAADIAPNLKEASNKAEKEFLACHFLLMLNWEKHGSLLMHLENQFMLGMDLYPKTLMEAYNLAIKWKASPIKQVENEITDEGVTLATDVEKDKKDVSKIKCFNCNKFGQYRSDFPDPPRGKEGGAKLPETVNTTTTVLALDLSAVTGVTGKVPDDSKLITNLNTFIVDGSEFNFLQSVRKSMIPSMWLLLHNQSTCGIISNKDMLRDIVDCSPAVMLTQKEMLGDIECFYFKEGNANIVSLAKNSEKHRVTFDSAKGNCFIVHISLKKMFF